MWRIACVLGMGVASAALGQSAYLVKDINTTVPPTSASSFPAFPVRLGGFTYFTASDSQNGLSIWRTDGTSMGTGLVGSITLCPDGTRSLSPAPSPGLAKLGTRLIAFPSACSDQVVMCDGTVEGMEVVWSGLFSQSSTRQARFAVADGWACFIGLRSSESGLFRTDGTTAGTSFINVPSLNSAIFAAGSQLTPAGSLVYFVANGLAARTDGTPAGTFTLGVNVTDSVAVGFTRVGGRVVFTNGRSLYSTDGTVAGTVNLRDFGAANGPADLIAWNGGVAFNAWTSANGREPWFSDGTAGGTVLLADVRPGATSSCAAGAFAPSVIGAELWFAAIVSGGVLDLWSVAPGASVATQRTHLTNNAFSAGPAVDIGGARHVLSIEQHPGRLPVDDR